MAHTRAQTDCLVLVPHERPHGIMRILVITCMLLPWQRSFSDVKACAWFDDDLDGMHALAKAHEMIFSLS